MIYAELVVIATLGAIVGSFLNVCILRLHTGRSTSGRSGCMCCGTQLTWKELIPVFSFLKQRGRCVSCGSRISNQYWIVELLTAILFVLVWLQYIPLLATLVGWAMVGTLVVIAIYDIKHTIVPNSAVYTFIGLAALANIPLLGTFMPAELSMHVLFVLISGILVALPLFLLWLVSSGRWMGFGDVKLAVGFGLALGAYDGLMALIFGFIVGAIVGVALMYAQKVIKRLPLSTHITRLTMSSEIPFAPFLITGFFLVWFFDADLIALIQLFYDSI